jgi:hypothetical protein
LIQRILAAAWGAHRLVSVCKLMTGGPCLPDERGDQRGHPWCQFLRICMIGERKTRFSAHFSEAPWDRGLPWIGLGGPRLHPEPPLHMCDSGRNCRRKMEREAKAAERRRVRQGREQVACFDLTHLFMPG